jgi:hypothetical protein
METFMGVPASGYLMNVPVVWLTQYDADGLVVDMSFYYDNVTLITQMTTPEWSPAGNWITSVPTPLGNIIFTGAWIPQDVDGTHFIGRYEYGNGLPLLNELFPGIDRVQVAAALAVKAGRNEYDITFLAYEIDEVGPSDERIIGLEVLTGTFELIGPNSIFGEGKTAYYLATQDANQDGFPDAGEEPVACFPWVWTATRLTIMPGCELTPMPGTAVE